MTSGGSKTPGRRRPGGCHGEWMLDAGSFFSRHWAGPGGVEHMLNTSRLPGLSHGNNRPAVTGLALQLNKNALHDTGEVSGGLDRTTNEELSDGHKCTC